jgi:hypothetical protein
MIVGIRGTSGWVSVEGGIESLIITDGHVHVIGTNPVTGEVKEIDVQAGQRLRVYLYNDRKVDSIMFELEYITERELPEFVLRMLRENPELLDKVCAETGWDKPWILGLVADETEPEPEPEPDDKPALTVPDDTKPADTTAADVTGDIGGNDGDDTGLTPVEPVVVKPTPTVLELMIAEARKHIVKENEDGTYIIDEDRLFDPVYYAERYPDVAEAFGTERDALLAHYETAGKLENRFTSKKEEDDKILADAIARLPKEDPTANQTTNTTPTVTWNNPTGNNSATYTICGSYGNQQAGLSDEQFIMSDGSTGTFNGTTFTISTVPGQAGYTVVLPSTVFYKGQDYTLNPSNVVVNTLDVSTVNATNTNPTARKLVDIVSNNRTNNANIKALSDNLGTVEYGAIDSAYSWWGDGYILDASNGANAMKISADEVISMVDNLAGTGLDVVRVPNGDFMAKNGSNYRIHISTIDFDAIVITRSGSNNYSVGGDGINIFGSATRTNFYYGTFDNSGFHN